MRTFCTILIAFLPTIAIAADIDEAKCLASATASIPQSSAVSIKSGTVRPMSAAEVKQHPLASAWTEVRVSVLGKETAYTFMCGTNPDGRTQIWPTK